MIDPPYQVGPFETIVNVHFGNPIYLVVIVDGGNSSFSGGPYGPAPFTPTPTLSVSKNANGVKLLDVLSSPFQNDSATGFSGCFIYAFEFPGETVIESWIRFAGPASGDPPTHGPGGLYPAIDNLCDRPGDPAVPIDYSSQAVAARAYLFKIPEGTKLVNINVAGLLPESITPNVETANLITTNGAGDISALVWSRAKGKITKVLDLLDFLGDGKPRSTQDDSVTLAVTSDNQGSFSVNVRQDKDPADAQTDNYGKVFQPYKVTLTPSAGSIDSVPVQPPPRLGE